MTPAREGGCLCGAVRYQAQGSPSRTVVCHCKFCQRCTGSAFAVWPTFAQRDVQTKGALSAYEHHSDESGRWIRLNFCPRCGTTVTSTFEKGLGEVAILGGTFDDTSWITVDRQVWTRSKHDWVSLPAGVASFKTSSSGS
jgi:hypothetical protein